MVLVVCIQPLDGVGPGGYALSKGLRGVFREP
jgi:hypothetical protein